MTELTNGADHVKNAHISRSVMTKLNQDQIALMKQSEYERGYRDGFDMSDKKKVRNQAYQAGYEKGFNDAKRTFNGWSHMELQDAVRNLNI